MKTERLLEICDELYHHNNFEEVIKKADEILDISGDNRAALDFKAQSLYDLDKSEEALDVLEYALSRYPDSYRFMYLKAMALMDIGDFTRSMECFERLFEVKGADNDFIRLDYELCYDLKIDQLIEQEKYREAFEYYLKINSSLERKEAIVRFRRHLERKVTINKKPCYCVKSSESLLNFLKVNGFKQVGDAGPLLSIDVISKTFGISQCEEVISESKFLDKVNFYPRNRIVRKRMYDEDGNLLYEGNTLDYSPYGFGTLYFSNGNKYAEGIFDSKGIVQGKEYYPSGQLRFEGEWSITSGYGPNAPREGNVYDEDGNLTFSGKFEIKKGGVGYPMVKHPKNFTIVQKERPYINYH